MTSPGRLGSVPFGASIPEKQRLAKRIAAARARPRLRLLWTGTDFSVDENFSDRDTFRSLMAVRVRGEGRVTEFVRPDSGGQKWTRRNV